MTRRDWIRLAACAPGAGCARRAELFPETAGAWRRTSLRDLPVSEAPDPMPRTAVERIRAAAYEGPGKIEARVYLLTSPAAGLELAQRWRPSADTVFFNAGAYFAVVKWQQADRSALRAFVQELEKRLKPKA